jgi:hypothetical protein
MSLENNNDDTTKENEKTINKKNKNEIKKNKNPIWHHQQELILKRWSEIGSSYRYLHDKSFQKFNKLNMQLALPVIIISTVTGTANFAQGSFPESWKDYVPLAIGFFNLAAGLITTISQFLRVSELLEGHRAASIAYSKFSRNISVELSLPVKERTADGTTFINNCRTELDRLIEQSPNIPEDIIELFSNKFPEPEEDEEDGSGNKTTFFKPEILVIKPVSIYRDKIEEVRKKNLEKLEYEENLRKMILSKEQTTIDKYRETTEKQLERQKRQLIELMNMQNDKFNKINLEKSTKNNYSQSVDKLLEEFDMDDMDETTTEKTEDNKEQKEEPTSTTDESQNNVQTGNDTDTENIDQSGNNLDSENTDQSGNNLDSENTDQSGNNVEIIIES